MLSFDDDVISYNKLRVIRRIVESHPELINDSGQRIQFGHSIAPIALWSTVLCPLNTNNHAKQTEPLLVATCNLPFIPEGYWPCPLSNAPPWKLNTNK